MSARQKKIIFSLLLLAEIIVLVYVIFMAFLFAAWMESDAFAFHATEIDWWMESAKRLFIVGTAAAAFTAMLWQINKRLFKWFGTISSYVASLSAVVAFLLIITAAIIGAANFVVSKPFI